MTKPPIPIVSLFCGPGGMDLGFQQMGFCPVLALDENQAAIKTYNVNDRRGIGMKIDLSELTGSDLVALVRAASPNQPPRGIIGGPPCQSFSQGNRQKKRHARDWDWILRNSSDRSTTSFSWIFLFLRTLPAYDGLSTTTVIRAL
jgi:site-specific DNA-cytosine methylase